MYAGYTDGTLLFAVGMAGREISAGTLHRAVGEIDSADFVLPPSNTMRDVPIKRASVISIQKDGVEIFRGSVADTSTDLRGGRTYSVDGAMLWLADIRKPPFVMTEDTVTYYVTALLTQYNAACLPAKQIQLGTIDTTLPSLAVEQTEYKTILALLQEGMQAVGGTLRIRYEDGGIYLDVLKAYNHRCAQQVDIRKNLLDLTDKIDGADLITRVYPIGKDGLTIASVNDGATYLANAAAEALYGRIDGTLRVDTDDAAVLKAAAATYLAQNCGLSRGIQVSAADLSGTDVTLEPYHIGDSVRVVSPPHGIDTIMTVSKLDTSLVGGKDTMTLGWSSRTLTGAVASGGGGSSSGTTTSGGGGTIDVDSELSTTSTNPVQNKVVTAALASKAGTALAKQSAAGLMSATDKTKLDGVEAGATKVTVDAEMSATSTNPVQNKAINAALTPVKATATSVTPITTSNGYNAELGAFEFAVVFDIDFDAILANLSSGKRMRFDITFTLTGSSTGNTRAIFDIGYTRAQGTIGSTKYTFTSLLYSTVTVLIIDSAKTATLRVYDRYLPRPNPDGTDSGKTLAIDGTTWAIKDAAGITVDAVLSATSTHPIQNKAVKAALDDKLDKTGGTLTGNLTGKYITGTWLQTTAATDLGRVPGKIAVLDDSGWLYYRALAEFKSDIGSSTTGADYIESQGTTGVWTWRKWHSGIAEMWGIFGADSLAVDNAWGSVYYGTWMHLTANKNGRKYPFAFVDPPVVTATPYSPSTDFWLLTDSTNNLGTPQTYAPAYACVLPGSTTITNPRIHYYVVGKYK